MKKILSLTLLVLSLFLLVGCDLFGTTTTTQSTTTTTTQTTTTTTTTVASYTVTFDVLGGLDVVSIIADEGDEVTLPSTQKEGYTFLGWSTIAEDNQSIVNSPYEVTSNITLYALWSINQYTISFESNGGSNVPSITQDYNSVVLEPTEPTKEGYTFGGWYSDSEFLTAFVFNNLPAENINIYAKWNINSYTLQYIDDDGTVLYTDDFEYNEDLTAVEEPTEPTKEGHTFTGWDKVLPDTMPANNLTIQATYTINQYTISFESNEGSNVASITQDYNSVVLEPTEPTREYYNFIGWFVDQELTISFAFTNMPAENITIYAKWEIQTYNTNYYIYEDFETVGIINLYPEETFNMIASAYGIVAGLTTNGRLFTMGNNNNGQLGNGTLESSNLPIEITEEFNLEINELIIKICLGDFHAIAMTSTGRVFTWGANWAGQLGNGSTYTEPRPIEITAAFNLALGETIVDIRAGVYHNAALTSSGRIFTWGENADGQLGDGSTDYKTTPIDITANFTLEVDETITGIYLGYWHSSALTSKGRVFTWGQNGSGYLGDGTTNNRYLPTDITAEFNLEVGEIIILLSLGNIHSAALSSSGRIFTWGANTKGILGDGTENSSYTPLDISHQFTFVENESIIDISLGAFHSSVLTSTGRLFTWGDNQKGQLGDGLTIGIFTPTEVTNNFILETDELITSIAFGNYQSVAISSLGNIFVWGDNEYGQLGNGTNQDVYIPTKLEKFTIEHPILDLTEVYDYNALITEYIPSRDGYTFDGWYVDYGLTEIYTFTNMPDEDINVYAKWIFDFDVELLEDDTYRITGYKANNTEVYLPISYLGKPISSIGDYAFSQKYNITSINISSSITNIMQLAFYNVHGLINIYVDDDNMHFSSEDGVLFNIDKTVLIKYPEARLETSYNIPLTVTTINPFAFFFSTNLLSMVIPSNVTTINHDAFLDCSNLISIVIPLSVNYIGGNAFYSCNNLTIYAEAQNKPSGWESHWNPHNRPVEWGYVIS